MGAIRTGTMVKSVFLEGLRCLGSTDSQVHKPRFIHTSKLPRQCREANKRFKTIASGIALLALQGVCSTANAQASSGKNESAAACPCYTSTCYANDQCDEVNPSVDADTAFRCSNENENLQNKKKCLLYISNLYKGDRPFRLAVGSAMKASHAVLPAWFPALGSVLVPLAAQGRQFVAGDSCEPHNCGGNTLGVIYDLEKRQVKLCLAESDSQFEPPRLTFYGDPSALERQLLQKEITGELSEMAKSKGLPVDIK